MSVFASEVKRVVLVVVTQDILGGQATMEGVQGTWAGLIRNMNTGILHSYLLLDVKLTFAY